MVQKMVSLNKLNRVGAIKRRGIRWELDGVLKGITDEMRNSDKVRCWAREQKILATVLDEIKNVTTKSDCDTIKYTI